MKHHEHRGSGNNQAHETFVMPCPDCGGPLMLTPDDLSVGKSIQCSHCDHELRLATRKTPGGSQYWRLEGENND